MTVIGFSGGPGPDRCILTSMTRITGLAQRPFDIERLPRGEWSSGDYVAAEVLEPHSGGQVELPNGRLMEVMEGDHLVGALGSRFATLELTGSWEEIGTDGVMDLLTAGGLLGKMRSLSTLVNRPVRLRYAGHLRVAGKPLSMDRCIARSGDPPPFRTPVILLLGTSMSAGKTTAARVIIGRLRAAGATVLGAKLAGAGRYRDILGMQDAGAGAILDFVDAGLPSTHCGLERYLEALEVMVGRMAEVDAEVAVVEVGASPLEPYHGDAAVERIGGQVVVTVLCASDPYAVVGALEAYGLRPDLVTGPTSNTEAGAQLVKRLTGLPVLDLRRKEAIPELDRVLRERLEVGRWGAGPADAPDPP